MKAMIFAAGLGSRLKPIYKSRTKQTACLIPAAVWKKHTIYYTILRICLPKKAKPRMN